MTIRQAVGCALGIGSFAVAGTAAATEGLDYTFLQLDCIVRDIDVFDDDEDAIEDFDDGNGLALRGSFAVSENFFLFGEYSQTESDVTYVSDQVFPIPADEDVTQLKAGVGTSLEIADRTDFVGRLGYTDIDYGDFDVGGIQNDFDVSDLGDDNSDGFFVDAGVRSQLLENLDGSIGVRYLDIEDVDNTSLIGNLMFELTENWSIDLAVDAGDELSTWSLGARWSGGR